MSGELSRRCLATLTARSLVSFRIMDQFFCDVRSSKKALRLHHVGNVLLTRHRAACSCQVFAGVTWVSGCSPVPPTETVDETPTVLYLIYHYRIEIKSQQPTANRNTCYWLTVGARPLTTREAGKAATLHEAQDHMINER
jgi:hypothetical protein